MGGPADRLVPTHRTHAGRRGKGGGGRRARGEGSVPGPTRGFPGLHNNSPDTGAVSLQIALVPGAVGCHGYPWALGGLGPREGGQDCG